MSTEIRWRQRYANFRKALLQLDKAAAQEVYSELERQGLIQCFEYCIELAWKVLQDLLNARGYDIRGPKPVVRQAFKDGLIADGNAWIRMLDSRNETAHGYDEGTALEIAEKIKMEYFRLMKELDNQLAQLKNE